MAVRRLLGPLVFFALLTLPTTTRASGSIEGQVFGLINGSRSTALIAHSGLAAAARAHSQQMAVSGGLHHDGADARVNSASPDPVEGNGAPDDGFATAAWCENVTYSTGFPESQVAQKLYQQWRRSAAHNSCMTNAGKNVGAVGVYYDGSTWWATFIAEVDRTPPGGARAQPAGPRTQPAGAPTQPGGGVRPQQADRPAPPATAPSSDAGGPPVNEGAVPTGIEGDPVLHDRTEVAEPRLSVSQALRILQKDAPSRSASGYEIDVEELPALKTLLRARRGELPVGEPTEIAALAGLALIAFRRLDRRTRTKVSWPITSLRFWLPNRRPGPRSAPA